MKPKFAWFSLVVAAVIYAGIIIVWSPALPDTVATHFGASGEANDWMSRQNYLLFMLFFGLGMAAFIIGTCYLARLFPPSLLNVPNAVYWRKPENYQRACGIVLDWSVWLSALTLLWLVTLHYQVVQANQLPSPSLDSNAAFWSMIVYLVLLGILIVALLWTFFRLPPQEVNQ